MRMSEACRHRAALWHLQVAKLLRDAMPGPNSAACADGELDAEVPVFHVATRTSKLPHVRSVLREAQKGLPLDRLPLAVIKDERHQQTFVAMPLDSFLLLVSGWWAATRSADEGAIETSSQEAGE